MKSKALIAMSVAALFSSAAIAENITAFKGMYSPQATADAEPTHPTLDMKTGGFQGWGPMANPVSPGDLDRTANVGAVNVFTVTAQTPQARALHLSEVHQARDQVWVANASLREPYATRESVAALKAENATGGTRGAGAGGFLQFRDR